MEIVQKILIVDDKPANLFALEKVLADVKAVVVKAASGNEALIATLNHDFSVAILDVQMPEMDGYELAEILREEEKTRLMPIIFLSAVFSDDFHVFKGYRSGAVDFITKPFNPEVLLNKVRVFLDLNLQKMQLEQQKRKLERLVLELNQANERLSLEIDERVRAERELTQSQERLRELNATKDKFFSIVAHDLKNPFNSLIGFSNLLLQGKGSLEDEKVEHFLNLIHNAAKRGYNLLENLLEWSRSQTGRINLSPAPLRLGTLARESFDLLSSQAQKKNIELVSEIAPEARVFADLNMMNTVVRNLVSNAIKFTPEGGRVWLGATEQGDHLRLEVRDNGVGIKPDKLDKLFRIDQSVSTKGTSNELGTGLGLVICQEFMHKNKGRVWAESAAGQGSSFFITLPRDQDAWNRLPDPSAQAV